MNKLKPVFFSLLAIVSVAGCNKVADQGSAPVSEAPKPTIPAKAPVVNPVDALVLNLASDKYNSQSGELVNGQLSNNGKDGFLLYGPYVSFQPGTYTVTFTGKVDELPEGAKVRLDVDADKGKTIFGGVDATAVGDLPGFEFTLPQAVGDLEVRALVRGGAKLSIASYQVSKKG